MSRSSLRARFGGGRDRPRIEQPTPRSRIAVAAPRILPKLCRNLLGSGTFMLADVMGKKKKKTRSRSRVKPEVREGESLPPRTSAFRPGFAAHRNLLRKELRPSESWLVFRAFQAEGRSGAVGDLLRRHATRALSDSAFFWPALAGADRPASMKEKTAAKELAHFVGAGAGGAVVDRDSGFCR